MEESLLDSAAAFITRCWFEEASLEEKSHTADTLARRCIADWDPDLARIPEQVSLFRAAFVKLKNEALAVA